MVEEIKQIKQKNDYKQKKEYDEKVKSAYEKYLDKFHTIIKELTLGLGGKIQ
ncbi:hypothetical protein [Histophilus somni]|uniref:hypothetical protein n=1 Tax=Histophilus somni TaxID=731 RepID=UPI0018EAE647|nr:hypothetical protein [Histophilus somni]QQF84680.1 hypothetical protein JFL54_02755 [Histophilus somni]